MTSEAKYITSKKAKQLTRGYTHNMNFTLVDIVNNNGDSQKKLHPGRWVIIQNFFMPNVFLKIEKDMTLTEYYVKEDEA
jgi:hypothetical protein